MRSAWPLQRSLLHAQHVCMQRRAESQSLQGSVCVLPAGGIAPSTGIPHFVTAADCLSCMIVTAAVGVSGP